MPKLRSELDSDWQSGPRPTRHRTDENRYELLCALCGQRFFVDGRTFERASEVIKMGLDNPIRCPDCEEEGGER
ncbi:hypothetical protein [Pyrinomonas methylaliphatogenes]|jgi:DNA-directed RNA polymerase subunit RPC12/RpoP|uniref:Uncharacterized protein n=1 Tax=Pyrinomonas methylaliphatogenes TaxID=454194 RepID=A0A0B6WTJ3_9BACT|nr:hypothetical protein [Pyrinomonas methylaliphatogenes]MBX5478883.1 hypothetical protein [Pyrinomonas methylaliphatogenes]CDM64538.1 hypothetical protein PYK22_00532 [Pyrinomonas methylaliphatogenes]